MIAAALIILGIACALYGITIMRASSGTGFFMFWFVIAAVFGAAGCAVFTGAWDALPFAAQCVIGAFAALILAGFLVALLCIARHYHDAGKPGLDYIIVLGAQVRETGPSIVLRHRLNTAAAYLAANPHTRCIVSGGQGANEPETEASAMARYLAEHGIAADRIALEDKSTSTRENFTFSRPLINPPYSSLGIVTNNFHLFRALSIARAQGFDNVCGIAAPSSPLFLPNNLVRESLAIAKALITR